MLKRFENLGTALNRNESKRVVGGDANQEEFVLDDDTESSDALRKVLTGWTLSNGKCYCDYHYIVQSNTGVGEFDRCGVPCDISNCS